MKISKLKYVFAFVLLVAVTAFYGNVQAVTMPSSEISISTIVASKLASIVDGDDSSTVTVDKVVTTFNTSYTASVLGTTMNPVQNYTLNVKSSAVYQKAYSLTVGNVTEQDSEFEYDGTSSNKQIGLALAFGLNSLDSATLANQATMSTANSAYSYATQLYIWLANAGYTGTSTETSIVNSLDGAVQSYYTYISNSVTQAQNKPSYSYTTSSEATANPVEMMWNDSTQRYEVTLTDANALDTMSLVNLAVTPGSGISYSKNGNSITFYTTEQVGSASSPVTVTITKSINGGRYKAGVASLTDGSKSFVYLTASSYDNDVYYVSLYTNAVRIQVNKTLNSSSTNSWTGDASVEGAVYGIYTDVDCTNQIATLVTGSDGTATSDPLEDKIYYVKEITESEGCNIDTTVYTANPNNATTNASGQKIVNVNSKEDVIYGGFRLIVSVSDLSGNTTKTPDVGATLELVLDSDSNQTYYATVDEQGYAEFTNVAYGHYTCYETTNSVEENDLMDPMEIYINSEETYIYSKIVNTEVAQRYVKIEKRDSESGLLVVNDKAIYQVKDSSGNIVAQSITYPTAMDLTSYETAGTDNDTGDYTVYGYVVLPEKLPYGQYYVYEIQAPYGYYNSTNGGAKYIGEFFVDTNSTENYSTDNIVVCTVENDPQKVDLTVTVTGNVLSGTNTQTSYGETVSRPAYSSQAIPGAVFEIYANEDIKTGDMVVHYTEGQLVGTYTTDSNGKINTELYLGSYTLKMVSAPEGYVLDSTEQVLEYEYTTQNTKTQYDTIKYSLTRQDYDLDITKVFSGLNFYKQDQANNVEYLDSDAYADVLVGIYAAEDITNVKGEVVIKKDTLVDVVIFDEEGNGTFASEYPMGKFYAKEIATNENYQKSEEEYEFECTPTNNTDERFSVSVGEIVNEALKVTTFTLTKIEEVEVEVEVEDNDTEAYSLVTYALNKLEELAAGILNGGLASLDDTVEVTRLEGAEYTIYYLDEDGKYYQLLEKDGDEFVEVVRTTDENGEIVIEGLPYGTYAVAEVTAPRYYDLDETKYGFSLTTSEKEAELVLQDVRTLVDTAIAVVDEDGVVLEGVTVQLVDPSTKEVVYEAETDEEGVAYFEQIRAGRYLRVVTDLDEKYVVPETAELYLEEDSELAETVTVKYVTGYILINKTDTETGEPVAGCVFTIVTYEDDDPENEAQVVATLTTDENGQALSEALRYGVYYVQETESPEDYELSELVYQVTITEDGETYVVDFTDVYTGDIAVALYAVIALASIGAIALTVKKLRMN